MSKLTVDQKRIIYRYAENLVESKEYQKSLSDFRKLRSGQKFVLLNMTDREISDLFKISNLKSVKEELIQALHEQPLSTGNATKCSVVSSNGIKITLTR